MLFRWISVGQLSGSFIQNFLPASSTLPAQLGTSLWKIRGIETSSQGVEFGPVRNRTSEKYKEIAIIERELTIDSLIFFYDPSLIVIWTYLFANLRDQYIKVIFFEKKISIWNISFRNFHLFSQKESTVIRLYRDYRGTLYREIEA